MLKLIKLCLKYVPICSSIKLLLKMKNHFIFQNITQGRGIITDFGTQEKVWEHQPLLPNAHSHGS